ncbi:diacylglycerol lipase-beta [Parasteatoda tepidariorum]|uniref:diacylglycerol lipase-beta n=1 Tax=Parasteatoda tepidariorum TaxID=114398 RepID=UPI00077FC8B7|nr:diacylglycerol lipase-beta [Parasteatoda tepidariorum]XP_015903953.1 diacylglycerol lipase-beta [Parasteatoda tepidariorum]XP_015903961.1 diacylglycerol lipase-beta [Parasteatoda tepidariorum]XP_015903968.1 diacylglycerol lipase-beta [Parasteatoda tepidariorum]
MPALIFFKRKWLIADDDLVIPFAVEAFIRLMWLSTSLAITWLNIKNCNDSDLLNYFLFVIIGDLSVSAIVSFAVCFVSSRGSVMEVHKRSGLTKVLYIKVVTVLVEIGLASCVIWFWFEMDRKCVVKELFVKVTTVAAWIYILMLTMGIIVGYDSLGSSKYWNKEQNSNSLNFFKKAKSIWKFRLKLFCCCADIGNRSDFIYVEISSFLASFLKGIDLVPTDILAGIITLSQKHALERRLHLPNMQHSVKSDTWLSSKSTPEWMTPENALYYLRIAKSTYGWLAFFDTFRPWNILKLASPTKCCENDSSKIDSCCYCNFAAVQKITKFSDSDIVYASFENNIYEPAFYVALDHQKKSIIIAIRGTGSFSDIITDIDAEPLCLPSEDRPFVKCHRGALRSAVYIQKKIDDTNVLVVTINENPSYTLVVTGHSLGGSTAAVLGFLLKPKYPNLQCYIYGPMGTISFSGLEDSLDFIFTVVVGDDMSPRLCGEAGRKLRKEIIESLKECKVPKYRLLMAACWYHVAKYFSSKPKTSVREVHDNLHFVNEEGIDQDSSLDVIYCKSHLFAPGRILYFEKNNWSKPVWVTGVNFHKIIVNPDMFSDHQPHKIQIMLERFMEDMNITANATE